MMVTFESISAGLIISLTNKYIINNKIIDHCMQEQKEYEDSEVASVATGVSDSSSIHRVHI